MPGVEVRTYKVIYDLLDDMRAAMEGQLRSVEERIPLGSAEVRLKLSMSKAAFRRVYYGRPGKRRLHHPMRSPRLSDSADCILGAD